MIKAIFFSRFHPEKGSVVLHQVPEGSIVPSSSATVRTPLFDFDSISEYIIPRQEFCGELITICANHYRIIGYPICVVDPTKYDRNEYIFNFSLVLDEDADISGFQDVVRMLASLFMDLEIQESLLSSEGLRYTDGELSSEQGLVGGKVHAICEMVLEDLNNYCEFIMPIDDRNTLNMKLFPTYTPPSPIKPWHVPLSTARLQSLADTSWDLTMHRIVPYINGVSSVTVIARLSETDLTLTRNTIAHLLYYGCCLLLDIFHFSAVYAPTADIGRMFSDPVLQDECARYVTSITEEVARDTLLQLYASLRHGVTLREWCLENSTLLPGIDVRRLITFGVIKGFLYRVHKYALVAASGVATSSDHKGLLRAKPVERLLDGMHSFDELCTELGIGEQILQKRFKGNPDVQIIYR